MLEDIRMNLVGEISRRSSDKESLLPEYTSQDEFPDDLSDHLAYCQRFILSSISRLNVLFMDDIKQTQMVKSPTTLKLPHDAIHPALLRHI